MKAPQIIVIALMFLSVVLASNLHGKPKTGTWNVNTNIVSNGLLALLLWWGGFFG